MRVGTPFQWVAKNMIDPKIDIKMNFLNISFYLFFDEDLFIGIS